MLQLYTILKLFDLVEAVVLNNFWNVTVLQIFFQNPLCHLSLSPTLSSEFTSRFVLFSVKIWLLFKYLQLRKNTSGSSKYLWLREIPLASLNTSGFEKFSKCLQLQTTPAFTNISSFERCLQLFQIPLASKNTSSSWLLQNPLLSGWGLLKRSCPFRFFL